MNVGLRLIYGEMVGQSPFSRNGERVRNPLVIGGKSHNSPQKSSVCAVPPVGSGKRAVQGEFHIGNGAGNHLLRQKGDGAGSGGVGAGRTDHIGAQHIENTDKSHGCSLPVSVFPALDDRKNSKPVDVFYGCSIS